MFTTGELADTAIEFFNEMSKVHDQLVDSLAQRSVPVEQIGLASCAALFAMYLKVQNGMKGMPPEVWNHVSVVVGAMLKCAAEPPAPIAQA